MRANEKQFSVENAGAGAFGYPLFGTRFLRSPKLVSSGCRSAGLARNPVSRCRIRTHCNQGDRNDRCLRSGMQSLKPATLAGFCRPEFNQGSRPGIPVSKPAVEVTLPRAQDLTGRNLPTA